MKIEASLAAKLAALAVHVDEHVQPGGHPVDLDSARSIAEDPEVLDWIESLGPLAPVRRNPRQQGDEDG